MHNHNRELLKVMKKAILKSKFLSFPVIKNMIKCRTCKKQIRFFLILLIYLVVSFGASAAQKEQEGETGYPVLPPLVYKQQFPCQACHRKDMRGPSIQIDRENSFLGKYLRAPDPRPRILERMHRNINLKHGKSQWCLNCHRTDERNYLRLINGDLISFEESYGLCGQCHGTEYRDWKLGIHGRRVGQWNGRKLYLLCVYCHDPHSPKFRKIRPKDPPRPPEYGRRESEDKHQEHYAE
jgi:Zn finger protein HypA/HybF involved in hydrogenase expression